MPWRRPEQWLVPGAMLLLATAAAVSGGTDSELWRYDRSAVADGEWWRLVTGHFAHLGWPHLLMNGAGLLLVWLLIGHCVRTAHWLLVLAGLILAIDCAFWQFDPQLEWYVGLSGVLHGLLVFGLLVELGRMRSEGLILLGAIGAKLAYEQLVGPLPGSAETARGPVIVNAHLYGAVAGALLAGAMRLVRVRAEPAI